MKELIEAMTKKMRIISKRKEGMEAYDEITTSKQNPTSEYFRCNQQLYELKMACQKLIQIDKICDSFEEDFKKERLLEHPRKIPNGNYYTCDILTGIELSILNRRDPAEIIKSKEYYEINGFGFDLMMNQYYYPCDDETYEKCKEDGLYD